MHAVITPLIDSLRKTVPMVVRSAQDSGEYLEGILSQQDLARCCELLGQALGQPIKEFGKPAKLSGPLQKAVGRVGGVRDDQCLYVKDTPEGPLPYATLWPWAGDPTRITVKVGCLPR